jgi:hypothetical protein
MTDLEFKVVSLIPTLAPGGRRAFASLYLRERERG